MFTIFIPARGKVKYDCDMFRLRVQSGTGWEQSAIAYIADTDVFLIGTLLVMDVEDKIERKKKKKQKNKLTFKQYLCIMSG